MSDERPGERPDYDWVTGRANCSAFKVFKDLQMQTEANVAQRNKLRTEGDRFKFIFEANGNYFVVLAEGHGRLVRFYLEDGGTISITGDGIDVDMTATLTLTSTGDCRLKVKVKGEVKGEEFLLWQVLRMALEELFFSEPRKKP